MIVAYDITSKTSFQDVQGWIEEIQKHTQEKAVTMLVGNKNDL